MVPSVKVQVRLLALTPVSWVQVPVYVVLLAATRVQDQLPLEEPLVIVAVSVVLPPLPLAVPV